MDNQKFLNISKKSEVNSKFILILVIIAFIIIGGLFAYEHWWGTKGILPAKSTEERVSRVKVLEVPFWEGKEVIEEIEE